MDTGENFDKNRILNFFAFFVESLSLYVQSVVRQNRNLAKKIMEDFHISELLDAISDRFAENPPLKFLVFSIAVSCAVPIVMFIAFGLTSVVITFVGFLFIEGTLLALGGLCMFVCIMTIILILSVLGATLSIFYVLALKMKDALHKLEFYPNLHENTPSSSTQEQAS